MIFIKIRQANAKFWRFHSAFWLAACFILFLSGLSQGMCLEMALSRNVLYALLGFVLALLFLPLWEHATNQNKQLRVVSLLVFAYAVGSVSTLIVNHAMVALFDLTPAFPKTVFLFGGALNFSLVMLVWCGFYLSLKQGLSFESGAEEQQAAKAIASISNLTTYPEFIALERLNKISLLPIAKVSLIKASGDYVELTCDGDTYLKRETISNIEKILNPKVFQRVHRSAIVNLNEIRELEPKGRGDYNMVLQTGENVACSRTYMNELKNRLDIAI